jgi:hypothetical protein
LIVTTTSQKNIHSTNLSSANIFGSNLITTDYAGFVKNWAI